MTRRQQGLLHIGEKLRKLLFKPADAASSLIEYHTKAQLQLPASTKAQSVVSIKHPMKRSHARACARRSAEAQGESGPDPSNSL